MTGAKRVHPGLSPVAVTLRMPIDDEHVPGTAAVPTGWIPAHPSRRERRGSVDPRSNPGWRACHLERDHATGARERRRHHRVGLEYDGHDECREMFSAESSTEGWSLAEREALRMKQARHSAGPGMTVLNDADETVPWDCGPSETNSFAVQPSSATPHRTRRRHERRSRTAGSKPDPSSGSTRRVTSSPSIGRRPSSRAVASDCRASHWKSR